MLSSHIVCLTVKLLRKHLIGCHKFAIFQNDQASAIRRGRHSKVPRCSKIRLTNLVLAYFPHLTSTQNNRKILSSSSTDIFSNLLLSFFHLTILQFFISNHSWNIFPAWCPVFWHHTLQLFFTKLWFLRGKISGKVKRHFSPFCFVSVCFVWENLNISFDSQRTHNNDKQAINTSISAKVSFIPPKTTSHALQWLQNGYIDLSKFCLCLCQPGFVIATTDWIPLPHSTLWVQQIGCSLNNWSNVLW